MDSSSTPLANPTAAPNLPMHFGIPFDNPVSFVLFLVCLVSGMCLVYLFSRRNSPNVAAPRPLITSINCSRPIWPREKNIPRAF
jgi:hypothetical protein